MAVAPGAHRGGLLGFLCLIGFAGRALAAESGQDPYFKGYKDFLSGVVPDETGLYVRSDFIYYGGNINGTVIGGRVAVGLNQQLFVDILAPTYVTGYHLLGGVFAVGVTVPLTYLNVSGSLQTPRFAFSTSQNRFSIGDVWMTPAILAWESGNWHWDVAFSVVAPTGVYHDGSLSNTSLNRWSFVPQAAITYLDPTTGWNASAAFAYVGSTENPATHYQSGQFVNVDFSAGRYLSKSLQVGIIGYYEQQVTGDSGPGAVLGPAKARVWALGPGATYAFMIGDVPITATAKYSHEFAVQKTFLGDTATVALTLKF